jgi:hypothetical protein
MIHIPDLTLSDIGRWVVYNSGRRAEEGRLKGWNQQFIFVVYACDKQWDRYYDFTAAATDPGKCVFSGGRIKP